MVGNTIWNYANASIGTPVIWNQNNPSYTGPCTTFTHEPQYRTSGTAKPIAASAPYNPLPYCWSCHGSGYWVYSNNSTALIYYSYSGMDYRVQHSK